MTTLQPEITAVGSNLTKTKAQLSILCMMTPQTLKKIFAAFKKNNPKPTTELKYNSHFELLISVMLSAQATDISVNKATKGLYQAANTPEKILALGEEGLKTYIKTIGLYNTKAKNVLKTCKILIDEHSGNVPRNRQALEALPGVGRKTANVVLNTAFGEPTMAVDTHIFRISNRTGIAPGKTVLAVEKNLLKNIPSEYLQDAHHWLILHGRYVCVARKPKCDECIIRQWCEFDKS
jgi:endonuclease III